MEIPKEFKFITTYDGRQYRAKQVGEFYVVIFPSGESSKMTISHVEKNLISEKWVIIDEEKQPTDDIINKPSHYHKNGIDVIEFARLHFPKEQLKGFFRINSLKYLDRYEEKGGVQDLKKSRFYLDKLIELEEHNG